MCLYLKKQMLSLMGLLLQALPHTTLVALDFNNHPVCRELYCKPAEAVVRIWSHCHLEEKVFSIREQPIDLACWLGSLAQLVEHQHIKLRVVGLSLAGVHFFFHFLSIIQMIRQ